MPKSIHVAGKELFNEETKKFIPVKDTTLVLEHSLISVSKWEAKWKKPFLVENALDTNEKIIDYFKCMTISPANVDPMVYLCLSAENVQEIMDYINDPMTATWFGEDKNKNNKQQK